MPQADATFRSKFESLGSARQIRDLAAAGRAPAKRPHVNSHIHLPPNFSAFTTTAQAVALADAQNVTILGASNYYDYEVYTEFAAAAAERSIFPLFGLEIISLIEPLVMSGVKINDPGNPGKMYVCGKGITRFFPLGDAAAELLNVIRTSDSQRMSEITDRLATLFAAVGVETRLNAEAIKARIAQRHECPISRVYLQERHLAQAFQEQLFALVWDDGRRAAALASLFGIASKSPSDGVTVQNEIRSYLMKAGKPAFVPDTFVDFDHAYRLILALGGIPCYPTLADGVSPVTQYEVSVEDLIADLKARKIPAAEFVPNRNTPEVLWKYVTAMRKAGLIVTAGTEHNTLDLIPLDPVCVGDAPIPDDIQDIFYEGACVIAAHQYLTIMGEPGYVDAKGNLAAGYASDDERIEFFRSIGAAVIAEYQRPA